MEKLKRPFATLYYDKTGGVTAAHGAAKTEYGAVRASVPRIFMGEHTHAEIVDRETGVVLYTVRFGPNGLEVHYGRLTYQKLSHSYLKRVK
jgi:hypothetical protein